MPSHVGMSNAAKTTAPNGVLLLWGCSLAMGCSAEGRDSGTPGAQAQSLPLPLNQCWLSAKSLTSQFRAEPRSV